MTRFTDIDLSRLPPLPALPTFDAIYAARMADVAARLNKAGIPYDVGALATDTVAILQETGAYRETLVYTAYDDATRAVLLATSWGPYLDHLGATQTPAVARLPLVANPRTYVFETDAAADWESDDDFRARIQLAPESLSGAGPEGAYISFALGVAGVKAAAAYGPMSYGGTPEAPFAPLGHVHVPIVANTGDGTAADDLIATVQAALRAEDRRPLADFVTVSSANIIPYRIEAVLYVGGGADRGVVQAEAAKRFAAQAKRQHRPGAAQLLQMLYGAAYVPDASGAILVEQVDLISPLADVNGNPISPDTPDPAYCAPYCTDVAVTVEVVGD
ncbi:Baseplate J family protein [Methylobacterium sp. 4-46]|uniref:baseplate assembly protein n=1 Tax=unclassified Methylobacterium TaxID=2615210 RepID=UPI000152DF52|nr:MULTISPECIES: baseplate J/gp47 family protein [Methylobacterium]ACA18492.1 Baseplate J family protein [Methylobacterium sp. 4-46]WFT77780.1 baseplate J/gp47 family protein [Methylobacterium nodulans]